MRERFNTGELNIKQRVSEQESRGHTTRYTSNTPFIQSARALGIIRTRTTRRS